MSQLVGSIGDFHSVHGDSVFIPPKYSKTRSYLESYSIIFDIVMVFIHNGNTFDDIHIEIQRR